MDPLATAKQLIRSGQFGEAFNVLENKDISQKHAISAQVLKAELLERIGRHGQSRTLAISLLKSRGLSGAERAACEYTLGRLCLEDGETEEAISRLQRAASFATEAGDLQRLCWTQIVLLLVVADRSGPEASAPLIADVRRTATRLGDSQLAAALHVFVGEMEARRGLLKSAERHAKLGRRLLGSDPNVWLEAVADNLSFAVCLLRSDYDAARARGLRAVALAERSSVASMCRACLGNLGNLFQATGEFDRAVEYFERALMALPSRSEKYNANFDSLARIRLLQNRLDECAQMLERIDNSIRSDKDRAFYAHRYAELTRAQLLERENRLADALAQAESVLALAHRTGDELLLQMALLTKAELQQRTGHVAESIKTLGEVMARFSGDSPELYVQYERIIACASATSGNLESGRLHYEHSKRLCEALHSATGLAELERGWTIACSSQPAVTSTGLDRTYMAKSVLHNIVGLMLHGGRPELVAREIIELLSTTDCVHYATAFARSADGAVEVLAHTGGPRTHAPGDAERCLSIGSAGSREVEIVLHAKPDVESAATINAVALLLSTLHDLERAHAEREEHATLWPIDELPTEDGRSVATGHMRELMSFAKRVATTNVSVLITGESGTGKEVLARAIHTFSDRAQKPFIPFNCTAIPRELLESQLFGYRRGAFTGAERDNPGTIRSAKDGTLFLDEIGELGLDLQPKLLRFLESGEICPLGESTPFTVNVRILAATNSNLEGLVREGRFREDLFYRLNVIRLSIRPLRERRDEIPGLVNHFVSHAAEEFRKGPMRLADETMERLLLYSWPGNVRQLNNELRRMVALAEPNSILAPSSISEEILSVTPIPAAATRGNSSELAVTLTEKLTPTLSRIEREMIKVALRDSHGKMDAAARALGISRKGLYLKRQRLGL